MIASAEKEEIRETAPVVQFQSEPPSHNPLVPSSPMAVRRNDDGIVLDWALPMDVTPAEVGAALGPDIVMRSEREVQKYPTSSRARTNLAVALANTGEVRRAITVFREALELNRNDYVAASTLGRVLVEQNRLDEAEILYKDLRARFPRNLTPLISLAILVMRRGEFDESERLLREGKSFGVNNAALDYHLAVLLLRRGDPGAAIKQLRRALEIDERSPSLYQVLGIAYALAGNDAKSSRAFNTALKLAPHFGDAARGLANILLRVGQVDAAIDGLNQYLQKSPEDSEARLILARGYLGKQRYSSARAQFAEVYEHSPESTNSDKAKKSEFANDIAVCYYGERELNAAERWFVKAVDLSPSHGALPYRNLGGLYLQLDRPQSAISILDRGKALFTDPKIPVLLSVAWELSGRTDRAIAELQPLADAEIVEVNVYAVLGCYLGDMLQYTLALAVLEKGRIMFPHDDLIANNLAYMYLMTDRVSEARQVLESTKTEDVALTATRGLLLLKEGNIEGARRLYSTATTLALQKGNRDLAETARQKMHLEFARYFLSRGNNAAASLEIEKGLKVRKGRRAYRADLERVKESLMRN